jgi:uncharacterized membrane protein
MGVLDFLRERIERKGGKRIDFLVFLLQLGTLGLFVLAVVSSVFFHPAVLVLATVFFILNLYTVFVPLKKVRNHNAYAYFFGGLNLFGAGLAFSRLVVQGFDFLFAGFFILTFIVFLIGFRVFYRKKSVFGTVLAQDGEWAVVQVSFDLCSGVNTGFYAVKTSKKLKKGREVKMSVKRPFGERAFPWKVTG